MGRNVRNAHIHLSDTDRNSSYLRHVHPKEFCRHKPEVNATYRSSVFHRLVNHALNTADSSGFSEHWIKLNWLPGVMPSPSVVKAQLPVMTR